MHFGLAQATATDPIACSEDHEDLEADAADADGFGLGGMDDDDDDSAAAAASSSAAPKVFIKQEQREDNLFVKRLKRGEQPVIELD